MISVSTHSTIPPPPSIALWIARHLDSSRKDWIRCLCNSLLVCVQNATLSSAWVSNNLFQHTNLVEKKTAKGVKRWMNHAFCTLFGRTQQLSYISLSTEPDQVYLTHCAHSAHVQGKLGSIWYKTVAVWWYHSHPCTWSPEYIAVVPFSVPLFMYPFFTCLSIH